MGPYEVLARLPGTSLRFVGPKRAAWPCDGGLGLHVDATLEEVSASDLLVVPGGFGARKLQRDERVLAWLRAIDRTTRITTSVCTGSLLLGAAGLLRGRRATTHWAHFDRLADHGATPVASVSCETTSTAPRPASPPASIWRLTLALELAGNEVAEAIQLSIEYDPVPPLQAGNAQRVPRALYDAVFARAHARDHELVPR